jgi:formylglycine-generating enzyme required for sulfatase activity/energy-coupling factor transporter ATP-binding protein EcfA2
MRRWPILIPLILLLAGLALTASVWLPPLLTFVGANSDLIQGVQAALQLVLWLGVAAVALLGYLRGRKPPSATPSVSVNTGGAAAVSRDVHIGSGDFVGRDKILATLADRSVIIGGNASGLLVITGDGNQVILPPDHAPVEVLLQAYYRSVAAECRRLPLGVIDKEFVKTSGEQPIPLPDIYVDLDVVAPAPEEERPEGAKDGERGWALRLARGEGGDRTALLDALAQPAAARVVLLGDPGSGKSTFVNYLAYLLATDAVALPEPFRGRLLVRLTLREVAATAIPADAAKGAAQMLWNALEAEIAGHLGAAAAAPLSRHLQARLLREGGVILLDGLDEVPEAHQRRKLLLEAVRGLAEALPGTSRLLVTARPYAYADKQWRLADFATLALAPFNETQVQRFVERFYQAVRPSLGWNADTARAKGERLQAALLERAYLADLASRPLLLTLMATLHSSWGQLPEDRADLYAETVKLLLGRWQRLREVKSPAGELVVEPGITQALGIGEERLIAALETLAFTIHERQRTRPDRDDGPADITEGDVLVAFKPLLGPAAPDDLLKYVKDRAGLLVARRENVYAFPHRSFQEYLAACYLANNTPEFAARLRDLVWADFAWWREVFLLGVGKKRRGGLGDAINVINTLVPRDPERVRPITEAHWRAAVLAGQGLLELKQTAPTCDQPHCQAVLERVQAWLQQLIEAPAPLTLRERAEAGDVLGQLGDPRPGVGVTGFGPAARPEIAWVAIPAGPCTMGSAADDDQAYADERPVHSLTLPAFYISRYPITNAQYAPFVAAGGYAERDYWTPEGWAWRHGAAADLSAIDDADYKKNYADWLAGRPADRRDRPYWWGDSRWGAATRPVVGISWHEALAYSRWLQRGVECGEVAFQVWDGRQLVSRRVPAGVFAVRLPSEAEWEKAARGPDARRWPWGDAWQEGLANTEEAGLNQTTAVGLFPGGASWPFGVLDMAGNVWEWTVSKWGKTSIYKPDYGYPYDSGDGREELTGPDLRVVRGGSWDDIQRLARCAVRLRCGPGYFYSRVGCRVVASL